MKLLLCVITAFLAGGLRQAVAVSEPYNKEGEAHEVDRVQPRAAGEPRQRESRKRVLASGSIRSLSMRNAEGEEKGDSGAGTALLAQVGPSIAAAAGSSGSSGGLRVSVLEQVVVTAQKYKERALDVPISLAVVGNTELRRLLVTNLDDLQSVVPGLTVEDAGNALRVAIRGISDIAGQGALVGAYLDEADVTTDSLLSLNLQTYDLNRVEVLRGPQGTLYGEGSIGGTIRYITNQPVLDRLQMNAYVEATFDQYGAPGDRVEAVVNMPIVEHNLAFRIASNFEHGGGWIDQPAANQKNINRQDVTDVRAEGLWEPFPELKINAMQVIHRATLGTQIGENAQGNFVQSFNLATTPAIQDQYDISNVTLTWDAGRLEVLNSTTYFKHNSDQYNYGAVFPIKPPPAPPLNYYYPHTPVIDENFSDELRTSNGGESSWHWTAGGFFRHFSDNQPGDLVYAGLLGLPGAPLPNPSRFFQRSGSNSWAAFGDTSYRLAGRLTVGAGVRYFRDRESFGGVGTTPRQTGEFTSVDPRFYLRYAISKDANVYASATKGFRSGGFNALGQPPYQPERAWTYELGTKMSLVDQRVGADFDVFLSNYSGYQISGLLPPPAPAFTYIHNAGTARIKGVEGDVSLRLTDDWQVLLSGDYIDARFVEVNVLRAAYAVGDPVDLIPRYQVTASLEREFTWDGDQGFARVEYSQRAPSTFRNRSFGVWFYSESDYIYLLTFSTGIQLNPTLKVGVFARNLLNERGYTEPIVIENDAPREQPRTFGVDFSVAMY